MGFGGFKGWVFDERLRWSCDWGVVALWEGSQTSNQPSLSSITTPTHHHLPWSITIIPPWCVVVIVGDGCGGVPTGVSVVSECTPVPGLVHWASGRCGRRGHCFWCGWCDWCDLWINTTFPWIPGTNCDFPLYEYSGNTFQWGNLGRFGRSQVHSCTHNRLLEKVMPHGCGHQMEQCCHTHSITHLEWPVFSIRQGCKENVEPLILCQKDTLHYSHCFAQPHHTLSSLQSSHVSDQGFLPTCFSASYKCESGTLTHAGSQQRLLFENIWDTENAKTILGNFTEK